MLLKMYHWVFQIVSMRFLFVMLELSLTAFRGRIDHQVLIV